MKHLLVNILLMVGLFGGLVTSKPALQQGIEFRNVKVESTFPEGITFRIEICGRTPSSKVVFHYAVSADSTPVWGWADEIWSVDEGQTADGCDMRKFYLETQEFDIPPFAPIRYFWSVVDAGVSTNSSRYVDYYRDANHDWQSIADENFMIWWHDRPDSFGQELMSVASVADTDQEAFYSITVEEPIIIVIANSHEEFFAWQSVVDEAGGLAFTELNLTIQLVEDDAYYREWLDDVIPHEISHIYFDHLVKRYSNVPYWLDEGMATYHEYTDHQYEWIVVQDAYAKDHVLSLESIAYDFGDDEDDIDLAYAESYYAVLYMNEVYGAEAVSNLLLEFNKGTGSSSAFEKAFGKDLDGFERDFMVWLETRIKTPPPNDELPYENYDSESDNEIQYAAIAAICLMPLCFVALAAIGIAILWILNSVFSERPKTASIP